MKGISPLLAAVILVALTISIAFIASSSISTLTQRQVSTATQQGSASSNVLEISAVECSGTNLEVLLKNVGPEDMSGFRGILKDATGNYKPFSNTSATLSSGSLEKITFTLSSAGTGEIEYIEICSVNPAGVCVSKNNKTTTIDTC